MSYTPLLPLLKRGTFITFKSSGEDVKTISSGNDANGFKFSKFALLNLPPIVASKTNTSQRNTLDARRIEGFYTSDYSQKTLLIHDRARKILSESFQNYILNMESILLESDTYDRATLRNASERIFFKWLKETGAIRFEEQTEVSQFKADKDKRFIEEKSEVYDKVVQYIGDIDISVRENIVDGDSYSEAYINIPSDHGSTPEVMFRSISDKNYNEQTVVRHRTQSELINGRSSRDITDMGLSVEAVYDCDTQPGTLTYSQQWMQEKSTLYPNGYYTDKEFGNATNVEITRSYADGSDPVTFKRSSLDGISIDFDTSSYKQIEEYNKTHSDRISTLGDFNTKSGARSFDFNCILVYYDVEDSSGETVTNLYGVLFLGDVVPYNTESAVLSTVRKIRHDNVTYQQGNSLSYKLNFKTDFHYGDAVSHHSVNDDSSRIMATMMQIIDRYNALSSKFDEALVLNRKLIEHIKKTDRKLEDGRKIND